MPHIIPWPLDILIRVTKHVRAKGGVFVCGGQEVIPHGDSGATTDWVIHRNQMVKETKANWGEVFRKTEDTAIFPYCGAYGAVGADPAHGIIGTPTFVMAGYRFNATGGLPEPEDWQEIIMTSVDGATWQETHRQGAGYCYAAGWSETEKTFYVQCVSNMTSAGRAITVLASSDGFSWSTVAGSPDTGGLLYAHPLLEATGNPLVEDGEGHIVPNGGYYGWDKVKNIIIKPEFLSPYYTGSPSVSANDAIEIIKKTVNPATGAVTITRTTKTLPIDRITCVAFTGDIWQAAGWMEGEYEGAANSEALQIATSIDDGATWKIDYSVGGFSAATCLMGAPPEMFT